LNSRSIEELNGRADVLEKQAVATDNRREQQKDAEIDVRFARMREERIKAMGPDGWKYYTPKDYAFYMKRELKRPPELRYKIFKDAPYWHTP
jgi:hypothetical protein